MKKDQRTASVADFMQAMHKPWSVVAKKRKTEREKAKERDAQSKPSNPNESAYELKPQKLR